MESRRATHASRSQVVFIIESMNYCSEWHWDYGVSSTDASENEVLRVIKQYRVFFGDFVVRYVSMVTQE
eukprot:11067425-Lingulodinium_polyedra.AAC.1